jgi:catechol 2,3-dioxygenase-like lactoylglutathione lyase family enzyme
MEGFVATNNKLDEFDRGKISRRHLIEALTLAATSAYAADGAKAEGSALKVALVNHISYSCPNFREAADWYSKVFNLEQVGLKDTEVTLPFGKMGEQPYNIIAKDVPPTFHHRSFDRPFAEPPHSWAADAGRSDRPHRLHRCRLRPRARRAAHPAIGISA